MKTLFNHPIGIYMAATLACLCIMIIIDYLRGAEAEHLNAGGIGNRLVGHPTPETDSYAIKKLGLIGSFFLTLAINFVLGILLIQLLRLIIRFFHS